MSPCSVDTFSAIRTARVETAIMRVKAPSCKPGKRRSQPPQCRLAPASRSNESWKGVITLSRDEPKAVLFDMDGVLIDSYRAHFESWRRVAREHSRDYTEAQFAAGFGRTSREVIAEQWQGEPLSDERIAEIDRRKEAIFREIISGDFPAMDGAFELIESLVRAGFRVAVGSSGPP